MGGYEKWLLGEINKKVSSESEALNELLFLIKNPESTPEMYEAFSVSPKGPEAWTLIRKEHLLNKPCSAAYHAMRKSNATVISASWYNPDFFDWFFDRGVIFSIPYDLVIHDNSPRMQEIADMEESAFQDWVNSENEEEWAELTSLKATKAFRSIVDNGNKVDMLSNNAVALKHIVSSPGSLGVIARSTQPTEFTEEQYRNLLKKLIFDVPYDLKQGVYDASSDATVRIIYKYSKYCYFLQYLVHSVVLNFNSSGIALGGSYLEHCFIIGFQINSPAARNMKYLDVHMSYGSASNNPAGIISVTSNSSWTFYEENRKGHQRLYEQKTDFSHLDSMSSPAGYFICKKNITESCCFKSDIKNTSLYLLCRNIY